MFCSNCGAQLADDANFCQKCGRPQSQIAITPSEPPQWVYCTLKLKGGLTSSRWQAWTGNSLIAEGNEYSNTTFGDAEAQRRGANMELVSRLVAQGWEEVTSNAEGCILSMRRLKPTAEMRETDWGAMVQLLVDHGWNDIGAGEYEGVSFDVVCYQRKSNYSKWVLIKAMPLLDSAIAQEWQRRYEKLFVKSMSAWSPRFIWICLLPDRVEADALNCIKERVMGYGLSKGGGPIMILDRASAQVTGGLPPKLLGMGELTWVTENLKRIMQSVAAHS
jgi:hypothetical protein